MEFRAFPKFRNLIIFNEEIIMKRVPRQAFIIMTCFIIGICFAVICQISNTQGIILDEVVSNSLTIENIMTMVIVFWTIIGGVIAAKQ